MSDHEQIFVGVDGGGTGCRAVIGTASRVLGEGRGGPANATSDLNGAIRSVLDALNRARMTYAMYVGVLQLELPKFQARQPIEGFEGYVDHMMATLVPPHKK